MTVFEVNCLRCGATYLIPRGSAPLADVYSRHAVEWLNSHKCSAREPDYSDIEEGDEFDGPLVLRPVSIPGECEGCGAVGRDPHHAECAF